MDIEHVALTELVGVEYIAGLSTFNVFSIEALYAAVASAAPAAKFGIAFNEGSDGRLLRVSGKDEALQALAAKVAGRIGAGHTFHIVMTGAFPLSVLSSIKAVPTVLSILVATGNECSAVIARDGERTALLGYFDGSSPRAVETMAERQTRRSAVRSWGYFEGG